MGDDAKAPMPPDSADDEPSAWEVASDADEVHALVCACDEHTARPQAPAPLRDPASTRRRVEAGAVHLLRARTRPIATFTLLWEPPFDADEAPFPPATKPAYLSRLAVAPDALGEGSLAGVQCVRRAIEVASSAGADALRSQANPDLEEVLALLRLVGFEQWGSVRSDGCRRWVYLEKRLKPGHR